MERRAEKSLLVLSCLLVFPLVSSVPMPSEFRSIATRQSPPVPLFMVFGSPADSFLDQLLILMCVRAIAGSLGLGSQQQHPLALKLTSSQV